MTAAATRRRRAWRALLSALAGGGLTAFGPLSNGAIASEPNTTGEGTQTTTTGTTTEPTTTQEAPPPQPTTTTSTPPPTTTESSPPPSTTTPAGTTSTPAATTAPGGDTELPAPARPTAKRPAVVLQRGQKPTESKRTGSNTTATQPTNGAPATPGANGANNVAVAPQVVAAQVGALAAELAGSAASTQALGFYRIPLFLLPIYQAAAVQYGVPWQILAAINEIETNYGTDLSVSTAGAVGWMQFMPATWIQYGVDALNSGYADPYNPVDAIFAAARYLRAAGAATDLHAAILAYNHSDEYVKSVLLRAKLISSDPKNVIATLTGLTDGEVPISSKHVTWGALTSGPAAPGSASSARASATAGATQVSPPATTAAQSALAAAAGAGAPATAPAPTAAAAGAGHSKQSPPLQLVDLMGSPNADVVAAQDGRVLRLGHSRKLGHYLVLRDVYGDVFTYAEMGSIASRYPKPQPRRATARSTPALPGAVSDAGEAKPKLPATAGTQPPVTLKVKTRAGAKHAGTKPAGGAGASSVQGQPAPVQSGKVRLFAHPGNPDAIASAAAHGKARSANAGHMLPLRVGSVVSKGTVLGRVRTPPHAHAGHLSFAIRPGGDSATIDPRPILSNWTQLGTALHPQGASENTDLLGATAGGVFLLSKGELERTVLSDPGITVYACGRHDIAAGAIDKRVLAVLEFLSRIGLEPTVSALRCGHSETTVSGFVSEHYTGDAVDISAINGVPINGHQGAGSITDLTIRALLTLQGEFVPHQIISLMQYPGAPNTLAMAEHYDHIHVGFRPVAGDVGVSPATAARAAHSAGAGKTAPTPILAPNVLSTTQWNRLVTRIGALPVPKVSSKPSSAAIKDPKPPKTKG